ncbi:MAG TPA: NADH-quinone oxidoreductase subunit H [Actinomycetota bacterium]|nr:NADH-quinone oxidoreductase subunit H [Actinomycetota bacterium]
MSDIVIIALIKAGVAFAALLVTTILVVYAERKVIADMQSRIGPNRWGPFGLLQTLADGIKLFFKEDFRPRTADRWTYALAPVMGMVPSLLAFAVIPIGDHITIGDRRVDFILSDLNIAVLYFLAMGSLSVYGVVLAGWASGSKYPLLGGIRASAQLISYEIALGLAVVPVVLVAGSLSTVDIVAAQSGNVNATFFEGVPVLDQIAKLFRFVPNWFIWSQWPAFFFFLIAGIAETNRAPFDLPEAETELIAGFHTEYSGVRFALFFLGEYVHVVVISAMAVTLFFGGWDGPRPDFLPWLWPMFWFVLKTGFFVYLFVWLRATMPRLRYDRLMWLGWKRLIPAALLWIVFTAVVNTDGLARNVRLGAFGVLLAIVVIFMFRGDPRLEEAVAPQRRRVRSGLV